MRTDETAAHQPGWRAIVAAQIGAHHESSGLAYEDACAVLPESAVAPRITIALADGHGHARHFRSSRGAQIAVDVATQVASDEAAGAIDGEALRQALRTRIGPEVVARWRSEVEADIAADPVSAIELAAAGLGMSATLDDKVFGYGATLILAIATPEWLMCAQIGDGDAFAITTSGRVIRLVPHDPRLDGWRTTSLCLPDALESMRFGALRVADSDVCAVLLATDGYANAHAREDWDVAFGTDIVALLGAHGIEWIAEALPRWVETCASSAGSGDDTTVALLFPTLPAAADENGIDTAADTVETDA
jgi:serine/threonine protein phosphatase PrpC